MIGQFISSDFWLIVESLLQIDCNMLRQPIRSINSIIDTFD